MFIAAVSYMFLEPNWHFTLQMDSQVPVFVTFLSSHLTTNISTPLQTDPTLHHIRQSNIHTYHPIIIIIIIIIITQA
jgi:hypothetical protein